MIKNPSKASLVCAVLLLVLAAAAPIAAIVDGEAFYTGEVLFFGQPETCANAWFRFDIFATGSIDDGGGTDYFGVLFINGDGSIIGYALGSATLGNTTSNIGAAFPSWLMLYRPTILSMRDITFNAAGGTFEEVTSALSAAPEIYRDTFDPATVVPDCDQIPLAGSPQACVPIPEGSVVGEAPLGAQAYYAPGHITNITLNPGTYWVLGVDETGEYYKVLLACEYLWVRIETMQPSYQAPQNGQPLPTQVVE